MTMGQNVVGEAVVVAVSGFGQCVFVGQILVAVQHVFAASGVRNAEFEPVRYIKFTSFFVIVFMYPV